MPLRSIRKAVGLTRQSFCFAELSNGAFKESSYFATYAKRARSALNIAAGVYVGALIAECNDPSVGTRCRPAAMLHGVSLLQLCLKVELAPFP